MRNNTIHKLCWSVKKHKVASAPEEQINIIRFDSINDSFDSEDLTFDMF